jgi:DNA polymerase-4
VATTATYAARALGVHSGMGLMKAAALAPDAILLPADFEEYRRYSRRFKAAVAEIASCIEDRGIDEIYIDLTDLSGETIALARRIKDNVRRATGLSCSIGIAPNKLLAKLASEMQKPDGLTVLTHADVESRIWPLPVKRLHGVGPRTDAKLQAMGMFTIGDLARASPETLGAHFGKRQAEWLSQAARGHDERPVVTQQEPKSISRETTFERDLDARRDRSQLGQVLSAFCQSLSDDLRRHGYLARTIGVKLRYPDFRIVTRDLTLEHGTDDAQAIRDAAVACLRRAPLDRRLRLLGVRAGSLVARAAEEQDRAPDVSEAGETRSLFE